MATGALPVRPGAQAALGRRVRAGATLPSRAIAATWADHVPHLERWTGRAKGDRWVGLVSLVLRLARWARRARPLALTSVPIPSRAQGFRPQVVAQREDAGQRAAAMSGPARRPARGGRTGGRVSREGAGQRTRAARGGPADGGSPASEPARARVRAAPVETGRGRVSRADGRSPASGRVRRVPVEAGRGGVSRAGRGRPPRAAWPVSAITRIVHLTGRFAGSGPGAVVRMSGAPRGRVATPRAGRDRLGGHPENRTAPLVVARVWRPRGPACRSRYFLRA